MSSKRNRSFTKSVKGKVLLGFFVAAIALGSSWIVSKIAFENMLEKLEILSTPSEKLRIVNKVFKDILLLDQLQNARPLPEKEDSIKQQFLNQSAQLIRTLDTLSFFCRDTPLQVIRIDSMKSILIARDSIYSDYVKVRSKLVNNKALSEEVHSISGLITTKKKKKPDSTVITTERRTTTTTVYTEPVASAAPEAEKKGFFNRVFGNKKVKTAPPVVVPKIVRKEEVTSHIDTLTVAREDSTIEQVGVAVQAIEKSQRARTDRFVNREHELTTAGNALVGQLRNVMQEVEGEIVRQASTDGLQTQNMVGESINQIEYIMIGFFFLTALLAYFIFTDITRSSKYRYELEEAKEEAEYHSMAKQRFLSNMSHEIRTPLQSIIGYAEALKKEEKPKKEDLETLHSASEHLLYLVNEVLDYSRIISDQFTFEERTFAITPLLNEVVKMLSPTATAKSLVLSLENSLGADVYLKGDPFRLRQILYNLLTNAIKFTEKGQVTLRVTHTEIKNNYTVKFEVEDTGIGLSKEQANRVFNQFEQADPSIARRFGGTGLGLSIVKALVDAMGGTIEVNSTLNKGTTFIVNTDFPKGETPTGITDKSLEKTYNITGKVWLVDDDAFILKWCASVLESHHIAHECFSSAEEVLAREWDNEVTVVLTDMRMPGLNGAELCQRLRKVAAKSVKIYVLTAQALPEEQSNLLEMGFDGILMKPFHANEILDLLQANSDNQPVKIPVNPPVVSAEKLSSAPDFSVLEEMTFGDESLLKEILEQFVKDTRTDLSHLKDSISNNDVETITEIAHRLSGRIGQIGAPEISVQFRKIEVSLRENPESISASELNETVAEADLLIEQIDEKILSYSI
ncbi:ATP-binding protein [Dyadobacter subterraneus]|uniref:histidine kinase n=1 Tax=Dyadobacter subterraneus TaxID=2773304 RepID=A0ABR9WI85_9BACT|nr:ATP-binding protein [Dyadobacter subterraneus]MBE9465202.1 response regulator [Dyadobacter subterraneus]